MELWQPSPDEPELFDWWRPLLAVSRRAREEEVPWPVHVDEFTFTGRVVRSPRPAVWVYEHKASGREMLADWQGGTYEFIRYRTGRQLGRFKEIDVRAAIWRARLPDVVEPVWYDEPPSRHAALAEPAEHPAWASAPAAPTRRRHLYVVPPPNVN